MDLWRYPTTVLLLTALCSNTVESKLIAGDCPTIPELLNFPVKDGFLNIVNAISSDYKNFGIQLLIDKDGNTVKNIETAKLQNPVDITLEILQKWLQGNGRTPVTWSTLVDCLKRAKLNTAAGYIEDALSPERRNNIPVSTGSSIDNGTQSESGPQNLSTTIAVEQRNLLMIKSNFSTLVRTTCKKLQSRETDVKDVRMHLIIIYSSPDTRDGSEIVTNALGEAESLDAIFVALTKHGCWDYLNYYLLQNIIEKFASDEKELNGMMGQYQKDLTGYVLTLEIKRYMDAISDTDNETSADETVSALLPQQKIKLFKNLTAKIHLNITDHSLGYVKDLWWSLAKQFALPQPAMILHKIAKGCVSITWLVPANLAKHITRKAQESSNMFVKWQIVSMMLEEQCIYPMQPETPLPGSEFKSSTGERRIFTLPASTLSLIVTTLVFGIVVVLVMVLMTNRKAVAGIVVAIGILVIPVMLEDTRAVVITLVIGIVAILAIMMGENLRGRNGATAWSLKREVDLRNPLVSLEWKKIENVLPSGIQHAQAVVLGDEVYIGGGMTMNPESNTQIYVFNHKTETVRKLETPGPTCWSALATFQGKVVLIGGFLTTKQLATNEIWALQDDGYNYTWSQPFAQLATPCWGASAVSKGEHLIVAGGVEYHPKHPLSIVQIYNVNSRIWTTVRTLPHGCYFLKTVLHKDTWFLGGGRWQNREVFYTSLESLISCASADRSVMVVWEKLPINMTARVFSLGVLEGQLLAVGGIVQAGGPTREIRVYDRHSWVHVDSFPVACDSTCCVSLSSSKEVLFFGGNLEFFDKRFSKDIYKAKIKVNCSLNDEFTLEALAHIETIKPEIPIFHILASVGTMVAITSIPQQDTQTISTTSMPGSPLIDWLTNHNKQPRKWRDLLNAFREIRADDVANMIEKLFEEEPMQIKQSTI